MRSISIQKFDGIAAHLHAYCCDVFQMQRYSRIELKYQRGKCTKRQDLLSCVRCVYLPEVKHQKAKYVHEISNIFTLLQIPARFTFPPLFHHVTILTKAK